MNPAPPLSPPSPLRALAATLTAPAVLLLLLALIPGVALAQAPPDAPPDAVHVELADGPPNVQQQRPNVTATLIADRAALVPGQSVRVGLRLEMTDGWHVYWTRPVLAPGGTGLPTRFEVTAPEGYVAHAPRWPVPERVAKRMPDGALEVNYVYDGAVLIDTLVDVPADATPGDTVELGVKSSWLVCDTGCIRSSVTLALPLPVVAAADAAAPVAAWTAPFEANDARKPALALEGYRLESSLAHVPEAGATTAVALTLHPPPGVVLTAIADEAHPPLMVQTVEGADTHVEAVAEALPGGALRVVLPLAVTEALPAEAAVRGVLQASAQGPAGATPVALDVDVPLTALAVDAAAFARVDLAALGVPPLEAQAIDAQADALAADADATAAAPLVTDADMRPSRSRPVKGEALELWYALVLALVGGLILNVMPCVLPVLSLKSLALVELSQESEGRVRLHALFYTLGVLVTFWALAAVIIVLQLSGQRVGFGFQFQNPTFVIATTVVVFAGALSLFGIFDIPGISVSPAMHGQHKDALKTSFVHGALATALSTPCSAPILGTALSFALTQPPPIIVLSLSVVGLGLALPVLLLSIAPRLRRFIPRPGAWMETFKHVIAFLLLGTCVWFISFLTPLLKPEGIVRTLALLAAIGLGAWIMGRFSGPLASRRRKLTALAAAAASVVFGVWFLDLDDQRVVADAGVSAPGERAAGANASAVPTAALPIADAADEVGPELATERIAWGRFLGESTMDLARSGQTVFIDFTASWCVNCKFIEGTVIETDAVADAIRSNRIVAVKADLSAQSDALWEWVYHFGRAGIPLYVIVPAGRADEPIVLPELPDQQDFLRAFQEAGPSRLPAPDATLCANGAQPC